MNPESDNLPVEKKLVFLNGEHSLDTFQIESEGFFSEDAWPLGNKPLGYFADGGFQTALQHRLAFKNIVWVGDGDSLSLQSARTLQTHPCSKQVHLNKEKDASDFAVLLDLIKNENRSDKLFIEVFFGLGNAFDHEMANLQEAHRLLSSFPGRGLCYFHGGVILSSIPFVLLSKENHTFSVFGDRENAPVRIQGARYSGTFSLQRPSHGLSNRCQEGRVLIEPQGGSVLTVCCSKTRPS